MMYVAFLRGVNVGGRIIKMSELRDCLTAAGLQNVSTVLQTGNVIFESNKNVNDLKQLLENELTDKFHYPAKVQIIRLDELAKVINSYPFNGNDKDFHNYVIFLERNLQNELVSEMKTDKSTEEIEAGKGVVYWKVLKGMTLKSPFAKLLAKTKYREFNTVRNINTLKKLI